MNRLLVLLLYVISRHSNEELDKIPDNFVEVYYKFFYKELNAVFLDL